MPRTDTSHRSCIGALMAPVRVPRLLHFPYIQIPREVLPVLHKHHGSARQQGEKQQLLHGLTSFAIRFHTSGFRCLLVDSVLCSSTIDSTSFTASPTALCTGSLSSMSMSSWGWVSDPPLRPGMICGSQPTTRVLGISAPRTRARRITLTGSM